MMVDAKKGSAAVDAALRQQVREGFELLRQGRLEDARELADRLVASHGGDAEVLFFASEVWLAADDAKSALGFIAAAVAAAPDQLALHLKKAGNLIMLRRRTDARQAAAVAEALFGNDGKALWDIGKVYRGCGDTVDAHRLFQKALAVMGPNPGLLLDLAATQFYVGDIAGAESSIEMVFTHGPGFGHALYLRSILRRQTETHNHVADLEARLKAGFPNAAGQAACQFALAKELEDLGQADRSFSVLSGAASLKRQTLTHNAAAERAAIEAVGAAYSSAVMQADVPGHDEVGAIFIVGMPRTGTTLLERMLGSHSAVKSAGELLDFGQALAIATRKCQDANPDLSAVEASLLIDFAALGRDYMASARQAAAGSRVFIDKMPANFIYCGLIRKALPKARIIHLVRDPMDSCYAVYKTLFNQAYYFSYDFDELAAYYTTYHQLMRHWHEVMPGAILDVRYEDLVTDTEGQARRILDWCGLDWQAKVTSPSENQAPTTTASAAQVREPIYTSSVQKWRNHEAGLAPLRARLAAAGIVDAQE